MQARVALGLATVACWDEPTKPSTSELVVQLSVEQPDGPGLTHYEAKFVSDGRVVSLDVGDEVRVTGDAAPVGVLAGDGNPIGQIYTLDRDDPPLKEVTFIVLRTTGGAAPSSKATFAPALADFVPAEGTKIAYANGAARVRIGWSNESPDATVSFVTHACDHADNHAWSRPFADKGALEVSTKDLVVDGPPGAPTCLRIGVRRGVRGKLDPNITAPGSSVMGYATHTVTVSVVP